MLSLEEFSKTRKNQSNNAGKLNYIALSEIMGQDFHKNPKFVQFSSKSDEKKLLRRNYQKYILNCAQNVKMLTANDLKELHATIVKVQGAYNSAKDLYNAKNYENEELAKALFSALKNANQKNATK